jgi:two-component system, NarL family, response regulator
MSQKPIHILVVDDHRMVLKGLAATIDPEPDMEVVAFAATGKEAVRLFRDKRPDVTVMDLHLTPEMSGIEATEMILREFPDARVIVLSAHKGDDEIFRALQAGAITYLLKETLGDDLVPIIREVHAGGGPIPADVGRKLADRLKQPSLTTREIQVLRLVAEGMRNKEIAGSLGISEQTAQGHVKNILSKLKVNDRTGAVTVALRRGIFRIGDR